MRSLGSKVVGKWKSLTAGFRWACITENTDRPRFFVSVTSFASTPQGTQTLFSLIDPIHIQTQLPPDVLSFFERLHQRKTKLFPVRIIFWILQIDTSVEAETWWKKSLTGGYNKNSPPKNAPRFTSRTDRASWDRNNWDLKYKEKKNLPVMQPKIPFKMCVWFRHSNYFKI